MRLRSILILLSILTIVSVSFSGYLYYSSIRNAAYKQAERQAFLRVEVIQKNLSFFLSENIKPAAILAGTDTLKKVLIWPDMQALENANATLDRFKQTLNVDVCYLMDKNGYTIASSNRSDPDSFVGWNFNFRPYFQSALQGLPSAYMGLGTTSNKRGVYYSHPVYDDKTGDLVGIAVIKASIETIEQELGTLIDEIILVVSPEGIIFITNQRQWLYHSFSKLTEAASSRLMESLQFGEGPWPYIPVTEESDGHFHDTAGNRYLLHKLPIDNFPGWQVVHMLNLNTIARKVSRPIIRISGVLVLLLCIFIGLSVFFLYRKANREIMHRKNAEEALRESETRYRSIYNNTPAMLHSIDREGCMVSVSDHWIEMLGYSREEVIGQRLTRFFTESSRHLAETRILPRFFRTGFCKDIPYQYIKKNGDVIDVLLSAIGDRDKNGVIDRSLAVSIDVTERNRALAELEIAKEELSQYSKDLEQKVKSRTRQLQRLSGAIIVSQEKERAAIARELHDEFGQILTAMRMDSVWIADRTKTSDPGVHQRALAMCELIDKTIEDARSIATRLRPGILDDLGLVDALDWYTADYERRSEIACIFIHENVGDLDDTLATCAYRITQEALTNVARHADASHVDVNLSVTGNQLILSITDDGRGFDPDILNEQEGLGVAGMRERAALVGGELTVISKPGEGTIVKFRCPVPKAG